MKSELVKLEAETKTSAQNLPTEKLDDFDTTRLKTKKHYTFNTAMYGNAETKESTEKGKCE